MLHATPNRSSLVTPVPQPSAPRQARSIPEAVEAAEQWLPSLAAQLDATTGKPPAERLRALVAQGLSEWPLPAGGASLQRWRALAHIAAQDLSLVKLVEGHTDAIAILAEAGERPATPSATYGMWASEPPTARVHFHRVNGDQVMLSGTKAWCSGAAGLDRALMTVWPGDEIADGSPDADGAREGPWLADVSLHQPGVSIDGSAWQAVGMAATASADVHFADVPARLIGGPDFYLTRPGFWQGGCGVAACWFGGATAIAEALRTQVASAASAGWHRELALGEIDHLLTANAALLREAAAWIDAHPRASAQAWALRTRLASDETAQQVLRAATRAMGAGPLCRDPQLARLCADLPVFIRQSHGDRDLASLGALISTETNAPWTL